MTATLSGFKDQTESDVIVGLGEGSGGRFQAGAGDGVRDRHRRRRDVRSSTRRAPARRPTCSGRRIETLPTISRSIFDFARTSPYFNESNTNGGDSFISVAGRNNRYNNIQIDGAVNNDVFGLAASGTPGGQTGTQPISLDAIQELQLVVSPYDVRQGGFSGGGVNAVTKSGTNTFSGTAYFFSRNQSLVGADSRVDRPPPTRRRSALFNDKQGGVSLGGPIVQNKAFFFGNFDLGRKTDAERLLGRAARPVSRGAHQAKSTGSSTSPRASTATTPAASTSSASAATTTRSSSAPTSTCRRSNQLTVRTNYVDGTGRPVRHHALVDSSTSCPATSTRSATRPSTTVGQLNSTWNTAFNELRVDLPARARRARSRARSFPHVQVDLAGRHQRPRSAPSSRRRRTSSIRTSSRSPTTSRWLKGKHTFTVGTHNEFFKFWNLFIQNFYGNYRFSSIDNFAAGIAAGSTTTTSRTPPIRSSRPSSRCGSSASTPATSGARSRTSR